MKLVKERTNWMAEQPESRERVEEPARLNAEIQVRNAEIELQSNITAQTRVASEEKQTRSDREAIFFKDTVGRKLHFRSITIQTSLIQLPIRNRAWTILSNKQFYMSTAWTTHL